MQLFPPKSSYEINDLTYNQYRCSVASVVSDSVRPQRRQPTRLPRPWDSPGKNTGVGCHFLLQCMKVKSESEVTQECPTLSDAMDCSLPGSSVHGIFQARLLEWRAIAFSDVNTKLFYIKDWVSTNFGIQRGPGTSLLVDTKVQSHPYYAYSSLCV